MNLSNLSGLHSRKILPLRSEFQEQTVIVCDTETIKGKPYLIQFYDGLKPTIVYVNERTIFDVYCEYVQARMSKQLSVWFFNMSFDVPMIHYPFKQAFTFDGHKMGYGDMKFDYVSATTWFGNHTYKGTGWAERDAFQFVFRGLEKVAKDLNLSQNKKPRPHYLGERAPKTDHERREFEEYAIADVLVLWELVYWILSIHREYNVELSVSLADLAGKIFRKKFVKTPIQETENDVTFASLLSYHGGKTNLYIPGPSIVKDVCEYDLTSAYPYAMTQIPNFSNYEIEEFIPMFSEVSKHGLYNVSGNITCQYQPMFPHSYKKESVLKNTWVTGYELESAIRLQCFEGIINTGYRIYSHNENENPLDDYVWHFFKKKEEATIAGNKSERLVAKLFLNALYGKYLSKIIEEEKSTEKWYGGVMFHPLIGSCITGFVRGYVHDIEHTCKSLHTSTDSFITRHTTLDTLYTGFHGIGGLKKEYEGDAFLIRPKVYIIFDKLDINCYHKFKLDENTEGISCEYCKATVLKSATHGFFGSVQMLLNMWRHNQQNYVVTRMMKLKEAARRKDPDTLPFVFSKTRKSMNIDWAKLTYYKGE